MTRKEVCQVIGFSLIGCLAIFDIVIFGMQLFG